MTEWDAPRALGFEPLPVAHVSKCRRAIVEESASPLVGEPHLYVVSIATDPAKVHPTYSTLEEAKAYAEGLLGGEEP